MLKKNYDVPDWRQVASSETALCFLAQYTDKTHNKGYKGVTYYNCRFFLSWRWSSNKKKKKGEETKEFFRDFNCAVVRGFNGSTLPTTPDRHVPTGSAPRERSLVLFLSVESYVFFRRFYYSQFNAIITHDTSRGNSTKIPSLRMDPAEHSTDPGRRN